MVPFRPSDGRSLSPGESDSLVTSALAGVSTLETALWGVVLVVLVLDVVLTAYGLSVGLVERNPVMRRALEVFGIGALLLGKAFALSVALAARVRWPQHAVVPPLALAVPWLVAVGINVAVLSRV